MEIQSFQEQDSVDCEMLCYMLEALSGES